ncbi:MAG TPA: helix-turn-helix transcriptional regulator [Puia sp.]|nr:helix-turn-helix transcriptional regulator [Puia sp.]
MEVRRLKSVSEFHEWRGLPPPEHPLISVVDYSKIYTTPTEGTENLTFDYYSIALKRGVSKMYYGQQACDFNEGVLFFMSPNQVLKIINNPNETIKRTGWMLLIHPDFLWNTPLAKTIKEYSFFDYSVKEALWLSKKEETIIHRIIQNIQQEYHANIDQFSQRIIISQIETLLNYSKRFYQRQFITRTTGNHQILERLEKLLSDYFSSDDLISKGLPTVQYIAGNLHISPNYLSSLLKVLTGQSTQQHIHHKLIEKAKEKLSTTNLSISEIAYELGFEHPQSFSKFFKTKTTISPLEFRQSFN